MKINMKNLKEHFIKKWSTWFALEPNAKGLIMVSYWGTSFILWQLNPAQWSIDVRGTIFFLFIGCWLILFILYMFREK